MCEHGDVNETTLRVGTFTPSVIMELARRRGDFTRAGLSVDELSVVSSPAQFRSLSHGELDVALTSPDNVLAYHFLSANPLGQRLSLRVLNALDRGTGLCLCLRPGIESVDAVRGATVGVDVATSGFAFVAYALLERHGVAREEYEVSALGSTPLRARALIKGDCTATVLNAGNELRAASAGCQVVARVDELGPYLGTVIATMADLGAEWRAASERFAAVLRQVAHDVVMGILDVEVIAAAQSVLGITAIEAGQHLAVLKSPVTGLVPDGIVDSAAMATLVSLRRRYLDSPELDTVLESLGDVVRADALA